MTTARPPLYFAFPDGGLGYDCAPCGRCCRGLGFADTFEHFLTEEDLVRLSCFASGEGGATLAGIVTFADGCRLLGDDARCDLHRHKGAASKPLICRLFPFSRLLLVDGLLAVLPQPSCPWRGWPRRAETVARHAEVGALFTPGLLAGLTPPVQTCATPLAPIRRLALECAIRDALSAKLGVAQTVAMMMQQHARHGLAATALPARELWLDLLRCAGEPPALSAATRRSLLAALPTLRLLLAETLPLADVPAGFAAFALWLGGLAELGTGATAPSGEDVLHLFAAARPLLHVLAFAATPLPKADAMATLARGPLGSTWPSVTTYAGQRLGEALLRHLRATPAPVQALGEVGEALLESGFGR